MVSTWESFIFFKYDGTNSKEGVLLEQIFAMSSLVHVGNRKYESETIVRAFVYFATSRALYKRFREDFELPCRYNNIN